jgi:pentatricopeptide repeat protein
MTYARQLLPRSHGKSSCLVLPRITLSFLGIITLISCCANTYHGAFCSAFQQGPVPSLLDGRSYKIRQIPAAIAGKMNIHSGRRSQSQRSNGVAVTLALDSNLDSTSVRSPAPPTRKAPRAVADRAKPTLRGRGPTVTNTPTMRRSSRPEQVEENVALALESMRATWSMYSSNNKDASVYSSSNSTSTSAARTAIAATTSEPVPVPAVLNMILFPTVRECNAALATFGDDGELLRALRLFGKMRKAVKLQQVMKQQQQQQQSGTKKLSWPVPVVPTPTLVTYSTLMSRAVKASSKSKPRVALRLWKLKGPDLRADLKAANILMNCYAKLADVKSAQDLLHQLQSGGGPDVPKLRPNLVTFNTLLDGCQKAGDLDAALATKLALETAGLKADQRTYTSLIATVARQPSQSAGQNDPTLAFQFLQEMRDKGIRPNGMTYSALIDVCGRCQRSDLALKGLRMLLRQKAQEQDELHGVGHDDKDKSTYTIPNEVGAWTAAINACGKAGRLESAVKLFYAMPNFGVQPNTVTCGCLTDSLLRAGRTADTLDVLVYMKEKGIAPSEVMYSSLISRAERLVQTENRQQGRYQQRSSGSGSSSRVSEEDTLVPGVDEAGDTKAIEVYTALMKSLVDGGHGSSSSSIKDKKAPKEPQSEDSNTLLLKVFLVFQEMKTAGAQPDLACYNALLKACARAGDMTNAQDVLAQMQVAGFDPNDSSWREMIRAAGKVQRSDLAESIWKSALSYRYITSKNKADEPRMQWTPSVESLASLLSVYLRQASKHNVDTSERRQLSERVVTLYEDVLYGHKAMGMDRIDLNQLLDSQRTMMLILQGIISLEGLHCYDEKRQRELRIMATAILQLSCFEGLESQRLAWASYQALEKAKAWADLAR